MLRPTADPAPASQIRESSPFGVLKLTLRYASYDWQFVPVAGQTVADAGSDGIR